MFSFAGIQALTVVVAAGLLWAVPSLGGRSLALPRLGPVALASFLAFLASVAAVVVWAIWREADWSWPIQDAMGVSLMLLMLRQLRLPNIKVGTP